MSERLRANRIKSFFKNFAKKPSHPAQARYARLRHPLPPGERGRMPLPPNPNNLAFSRRFRARVLLIANREWRIANGGSLFPYSLLTIRHSQPFLPFEGGGAPKGASIHGLRRHTSESPPTVSRGRGMRLPSGRARLPALRCGTRHRLLPRWLSSRPLFPGTWRCAAWRVFCPPSACPSPASSSRSGRSAGRWCPGAARERVANPRAGTAARSTFRTRLESAPRRAIRFGLVTETETIVKGCRYIGDDATVHADFAARRSWNLAPTQTALGAAG